MDDRELKAWFTLVVLPLEPRLLSFLARRWKDRDEQRDMLHDIYERAIGGARNGIPENAPAYIFAIARNLVISRARRGKIVSIDLVADIEEIIADHDGLTPERHVAGREELHRALEGMENLPPRCREMVRLRKVEGLSIREIAGWLGVSPAAVERQLTFGMRALSDFMLGGSGRIKRQRGGRAAEVVKGGRQDG